MQGIYLYIYVSETKNACKLYNVAAVLYLQSVLQVMLFLPRLLLLLLLLLSSVLKKKARALLSN